MSDYVQAVIGDNQAFADYVDPQGEHEHQADPLPHTALTADEVEPLEQKRIG